MAAAASAAAALEPLRAERDRLKAHVAASAPLLSAMDRAAGALGRRLTLLEDTVATTAAQQQGSLEAAVEGLLGCVESALDAFGGTARAAAGDATPALLGALEGLVTQLLATLSKGGKVRRLCPAFDRLACVSHCMPGVFTWSWSVGAACCSPTACASSPP